ncbi:MAG: hypothetical protein KF746_24680 [Chitinophagaceae bacterium]|nr:hypothetical protein [Chitinophagaceae bacterium]
MIQVTLPEPAFGLEGFFTVTFYLPMELKDAVLPFSPFAIAVNHFHAAVPVMEEIT